MDNERDRALIDAIFDECWDTEGGRELAAKMLGNGLADEREEQDARWNAQAKNYRITVEEVTRLTDEVERLTVDMKRILEASHDDAIATMESIARAALAGSAHKE